MGGEAAGDGLIIIWNRAYSATAQMVSEATVTKESYLAVVDQVLAGIVGAQCRLIAEVKGVSDAATQEAAFVNKAQGDFAFIETADAQVSELGAAPLKCNDFDLKLSSVMALI